MIDKDEHKISHKIHAVIIKAIYWFDDGTSIIDVFVSDLVGKTVAKVFIVKEMVG